MDLLYLVIFKSEKSGATLEKCLLETKVINWRIKLKFLFVSEIFTQSLKFVINEKERIENIKIDVRFWHATFYFKSKKECSALPIEPRVYQQYLVINFNIVVRGSAVKMVTERSLLRLILLDLLYIVV